MRIIGYISTWLMFAFVPILCGQSLDVPFTLSWTDGKCPECKTAASIAGIQFVSRSEAWAVGFKFPPFGAQGAGDIVFVMVHTLDAGHTWNEVPQTHRQIAFYRFPTFSFLDGLRGWIGWSKPNGSKVIRTHDGGVHLETVSDTALQKIRFFDENNGYGSEGNKFMRTTDGGQSWTETLIPHLRTIDRVLFS